MVICFKTTENLGSASEFVRFASHVNKILLRLSFKTLVCFVNELELHLHRQSFLFCTLSDS